MMRSAKLQEKGTAGARDQTCVRNVSILQFSDCLNTVILLVTYDRWWRTNVLPIYM